MMTVEAVHKQQRQLVEQRTFVDDHHYGHFDCNDWILEVEANQQLLISSYLWVEH